jgi:hypothetical protein
MNSRMAWSYERFELEDVRLFKTADFDCSRSGSLRTVFGTRLRLLFAIGSGLRCRGEKHDPVPDLLTSSAFVVTYRHITSGYARDTAKCVSATQQRVARRRSQLTTSHTVADTAICACRMQRQVAEGQCPPTISSWRPTCPI